MEHVGEAVKDYDFTDIESPDEGGARGAWASILGGDAGSGRRGDHGRETAMGR
jgi:hypothetical protein